MDKPVEAEAPVSVASPVQGPAYYEVTGVFAGEEHNGCVEVNGEAQIMANLNTASHQFQRHGAESGIVGGLNSASQQINRLNQQFQAKMEESGAKAALNDSVKKLNEVGASVAKAFQRTTSGMQEHVDKSGISALGSKYGKQLEAKIAPVGKELDAAGKRVHESVKAAQTPRGRIAVQVPQGATAGDILKVAAPNQVHVQARVPGGLKEGSVFVVLW